MRGVSDTFLLNVAEVSGALVGLFLVGIFFFVETGLGRLDKSREVLEPYFRAGTRIVLVLFAISLLLSLTLVVLEPTWNRLLFVVLSLVLLAANVDTAIRIRAVTRVTRSTALLANEVVGTAGVLVIVVLPWALGGLRPTRDDLTWAILLSFAAAFLSVCALVLSAFDIGRFEAAAETKREGRARRADRAPDGESAGSDQEERGSGGSP